MSEKAKIKSLDQRVTTHCFLTGIVIFLLLLTLLAALGLSIFSTIEVNQKLDKSLTLNSTIPTSPLFNSLDFEIVGNTGSLPWTNQIDVLFYSSVAIVWVKQVLIENTGNVSASICFNTTDNRLFLPDGSYQSSSGTFAFASWFSAPGIFITYQNIPNNAGPDTATAVQICYQPLFTNNTVIPLLSLSTFPNNTGLIMFDHSFIIRTNLNSFAKK